MKHCAVGASPAWAPKAADGDPPWASTVPATAASEHFMKLRRASLSFCPWMISYRGDGVAIGEYTPFGAASVSASWVGGDARALRHFTKISTSWWSTQLSVLSLARAQPGVVCATFVPLRQLWSKPKSDMSHVAVAIHVAGDLHRAAVGGDGLAVDGVRASVAGIADAIAVGISLIPRWRSAGNCPRRWRSRRCPCPGRNRRSGRRDRCPVRMRRCSRYCCSRPHCPQPGTSQGPPGSPQLSRRCR